MSKFFVTAILSMLLSLSSGCTPGAKSEFGFRLPDGNAEAGRETFAYMQCNQCHTVVGETFDDIPFTDPPYVELGGNLSRIKTYGELVTSIINPSHELAAGYEAEVVSEDGESNMYVYNSYMTVQELIDLVAFLQSRYQVIPPEYHYRVYPWFSYSTVNKWATMLVVPWIRQLPFTGFSMMSRFPDCTDLTCLSAASTAISFSAA